MFWLGIDVDKVEKSHVKMWLLAKATVGRLGLPYPRPDVPSDVADAVYNVLRESGKRYMNATPTHPILIKQRESKPQVGKMGSSPSPP